MIKSNFHIHSTYCDGKNTMEEMVLAAIGAGLDSIGFTSHNPLSGEHWTMKADRMDSYRSEIRGLKEKYRSRLEIYEGLEVDFLPEKGLNPLAAEEIPTLDYWIGSVHGIACWEEDRYWYVDAGPEEFEKGLNHFFKGDGKKAVTRYYEQLTALVQTEKPTIVGHMDLVKKNNEQLRFFREEETWYKDRVNQFLKEVKISGSILEINTGGVRRYGVSCFYPSPWILDRIRDLDLPWTLNGDSHDKDGLTFYYRETEALLKEKGLDRFWTLEEGTWTQKKF